MARHFMLHTSILIYNYEWINYYYIIVYADNNSVIPSNANVAYYTRISYFKRYEFEI